MNRKRLLQIGYVVRQLGNSNEFIAKLDKNISLQNSASIYLEKGQEIIGPVKILSVRKYKSKYILKLKGKYNNKNGVNIVGSFIEIETVLGEGKYWKDEILNCNVFTDRDEFLGSISDIISTGANDVYVINSSIYGEILLPATKEVVRSIDIKLKKIIVHLLPGLVEKIS